MTPPHLLVLAGEDPPPGMDVLDSDPRLGSIRYVDADTLPEALPEADALFVWELFSRAVETSWPTSHRLRWIHAATAGVDNLIFPALAHDDDVELTNSRGVFDEAIGEYVLGLVLAFAKGFPTTFALQRHREWRHRETERVVGRPALVIGTGPIGRSVARSLRAVGMKVSGLGRRRREIDPDFGTVGAGEDLDAAIAEADFVVLAAPLTEATQGMIDARVLKRMRASARLINVGRGALLVEDDLVAALRAGEIAGAALDVFASEPLAADSPLWTLPEVIVSPHMSGDTVGWRDELVRLFLDNLDRFLDGRALRNVVDKRRGYVSDSP